jgi:hypothetical protein
MAAEVRDRTDRRLHRDLCLGVVVSVRSKAALSGLVVLVAYLAGAVLSGHLSPFARRPLLDGVINKHPYNWASPPPALAPTNKQPESGSYTISLKGGSQPGVFQTNDGQGVLILPTGAIAPSKGATSLEIMLTPLDPSKFGTPSGGLAIAGNVYRITATYQPGGSPVARLQSNESEVALLYPLTNTTRHDVIQSTNGKTWTKLPSTDQIASTQVLATKVTTLGYFAVGVPASGATPAPTSSSSGIGGVLTAVIAAVAIIVLGLAFRAEYVRRRRARAGPSRGRPRHRR